MVIVLVKWPAASVQVPKVGPVLSKYIKCINTLRIAHERHQAPAQRDVTVLVAPRTDNFFPGLRPLGGAPQKQPKASTR
jgi:hypothetical protein